MNTKNVIEKVAEKHGISYAEVYGEMQKAIRVGYESKDPRVKEKWQRISLSGDIPTPETFIQGILTMIKE